MEEELQRALRDVRDKLLSNPVSPRVEEPADINLQYCRYVAETVTKEVGEDLDVEILEDGGHGYAHTWVRYNGRHYDAECVDGVPTYQRLPFFQRHPEAAIRVVPATVDAETLRNRNHGALYPAILSPESTVGEVVEAPIRYWPYALAGVCLGTLLLLISFSGEWAIQVQVLRDTPFLHTVFSDLEILGKLLVIISPIVFFVLLPASPDQMVR